MGDQFLEGCFWRTMRVLEVVLEIGTALFIVYQALRYLGFVQPWI